MEVPGVVVLVVFVLAVIGAVGDDASAVPAARPTPARRADAAFLDGVIFSHYFLDDAAEELHDLWADDLEEDGDFHD